MRALFDGPGFWVLLLAVVVLFGAKRLPDAARGMGRSLRIFKAETKGLLTDDDGQSVPPPAPAQLTGQPVPPPAAQPVPTTPAPEAQAAPAAPAPAPSEPTQS